VIAAGPLRLLPKPLAKCEPMGELSEAERSAAWDRNGDPVSPAPPNDADLTRDQSRSRRKRATRARTISVKRMSKRDLYVGRLMYPDEDDLPHRPATRAECKGHEGPCPFVSCRHHLYLDVSPRTGAIKLNFPDIEPHEMTHSCSLDIADDDGATLEHVGEVMNFTRERTRQIEVRALAKIANGNTTELREHAGDGTRGRRRTLPILEDLDDESDEFGAGVA
jgi:predicted nucleic acid-binding Zn ribbon protein